MYGKINGMKEYSILLIIKIIFAILASVIMGNGAVVWFNHMPARWFDDDGLPEDIENRQRIRSTPWKYIFVSYFLSSGIYLAIMESIQFEIATLVVFFIVLEMAISDIKYQVVPDQLNVILAVSSIGFVTMHDRWYDIIIGAVIGLGLSMITYLLGRLIYKRDVIGGADIKFYIAIGLVTGYFGIVIIYLITSICMGVYDFYLIYTKQIEKSDQIPMLPFALLSTTVYMLFVWSNMGLLEI